MSNLKFRFPILYYQVKVSSYQINGGNRYYVSVMVVVVLKRVEPMQECKFKIATLKSYLWFCWFDKKTSKNTYLSVVLPVLLSSDSFKVFTWVDIKGSSNWFCVNNFRKNG